VDFGLRIERQRQRHKNFATGHPYRAASVSASATPTGGHQNPKTARDLRKKRQQKNYCFVSRQLTDIASTSRARQEADTPTGG